MNGWAQRWRRTGAAWLLGLAVTGSVRGDEAIWWETLTHLSDALVSTQITDETSPEFGALVCPSTNPQLHPLHSRAAEAVYPLAVLYQKGGDVRYRDAAISLARWLFGKQQANGAWGEAWPDYDGWAGTTSDQLISLAGAYPLLEADLTPEAQMRWRDALRRAADYIVATFPVGNINYSPTGAVALRLAADALHETSPIWSVKAEALVQQTLDAVNEDGLLTGEGGGVDLGYNLAQSIGFLALYARLTGNEKTRTRAEALLRTHAAFVYPNGAVDNSWGTRSYKWTFESGTKTAPGVPFTFALLADMDPQWARMGDRCLSYLNRFSTHDGWVTGGWRTTGAATMDPPCLYSTFARAQSIAMGLVYGQVDVPVDVPAESPEKLTAKVFPSVNVAVVSTPKLKGTISAYGAIGRYCRGQVSRGGSLTCLWLDGVNGDGFAQASSVTVYRREEGIHMPYEPADLQPLTARVEWNQDGLAFSSLLEAEAAFAVSEEAEAVTVQASGELRSIDGATGGVSYEISHRFTAHGLVKTWTIRSATATTVRVVEPWLVPLQPAGPAEWRLGDSNWRLQLTQRPESAEIQASKAADRHWAPFPGAEAYPLTIEVPLSAGDAAVVELTLAVDGSLGR